MNPWPDVGLIRVVYEERLKIAEQARRAQTQTGPQPSLVHDLRQWLGERLVRLGTWLKPDYPSGHDATTVSRA